ncbi:DUF262 domain-containing protein [Pseudomonas cucumis]|uniref:DUF262 domain-containing protein n=1 Tax=Pseudomonas cucumis TaxID=2954082 RepID=UPI0027357079|nr:DUF262 domain-containing protein [Pseudomonas cucumis]WLG91199.1 DUF262 domain-containing protein [Pseudomonas cucumis]
MSKRDPKPEVLRLEELALLVKSGDIKLPRFQRPFVWRKTDMLKLLDSIYKGYPIGSLLLWNSSQRLKSERDIAGLKVSDEPTLYPTSYLLDGQQRLTTLCGALFWEGGALNSMWNIHFDLESEEFIHAKISDSVTTYPLNKLIDTTDFIQQCMKFSHHEKGRIFTGRAERLLRAIKDYKIAVVKIGDMSIEEVAPIFERINSTGRKLTIVDLMMAATWSNGFDLASEIQNIQESCIDLGFNGVSEPLILRSIAASADLGINKDDIQKLRNLSSVELSAASSKCRKAIISAINWMSVELPVRDASYLPYGLFFTYVVEFFRIADKPGVHQLAEIRTWFWFTSATLHFGGASTGDIARDLTNIRDFSTGARSQLFARGTIDISRLLYDKFSLKNASSTVFSLMLLSTQPSTTLSGKVISLEAAGEKNSKLFGRVATRGMGDINIGVVLDPFREQPNLNAEPDVLAEHLLNKECMGAVKNGDGDSFINERSSVISTVVERLTDCQTTYNFESIANGFLDLDKGESDEDL